jgi:hypothetical protein
MSVDNQNLDEKTTAHEKLVNMIVAFAIIGIFIKILFF